MNKHKLIIIFVFASFLTACSAIGSAAISKNVAPSELVAEEPTQVPASPLDGITFADGGTLYRINETGGADAISGCAQVGDLSPDGSQIVYAEDGELWIVTLSDCGAMNMTNTPDSFEINPQWWPAQGNKIVFGVNPQYSSGIPAIMNANGSEYRLLDEKDTSTYRPALSPNAPYIAYLSGDGPIIKVVGEGVIPMDAVFYGLPEGAVQRMDSPAWSPDGTKLAWIATVSTDNWYMQVIVFNLATQSHTVVYNYVPLGRDGWVSAPVWSPDGQWLIFHAIAENVTDAGEFLLDEFGYVVARADGTESHVLRPEGVSASEFLEQGATPVWRADSLAVAFTYLNAPEAHYYTEIGQWVLNGLSLPATSTLLDW